MDILWNIIPKIVYTKQATKPPIAIAVYPPAAKAASTGATKAPLLEINIGDCLLVTSQYTIVAAPAPTKAPERGTPHIYAINAVAVKQLNIIYKANNISLLKGNLSFTLYII